MDIVAARFCLLFSFFAFLIQSDLRDDYDGGVFVICFGLEAEEGKYREIEEDWRFFALTVGFEVGLLSVRFIQRGEIRRLDELGLFGVRKRLVGIPCKYAISLPALRERNWGTVSEYIIGRPFASRFLISIILISLLFSNIMSLLIGRRIRPTHEYGHMQVLYLN